MRHSRLLAPLLALLLAVGLGLTSPAGARPAPGRGDDTARATFQPPRKCTKLPQGSKARKQCIRKAKQAWKKKQLRKKKRRCAARQGFWIAGTCWTNPSVRTRISAHRGGGGTTAELTVAAYQKALATGVGTVHVPVRFTRDDLPVVSATDTPGARCSDAAPAQVGDPAYPYAHRPISTLGISQLRMLECGSWSPDGVTKAPGSRFLDLDTVLQVLDHHGAAATVALDLEVPRATDAQLATLLQALVGHPGPVRVSSTDWSLLRRLRARPGTGAIATIGIDHGRRGNPVAAASAAGLSGWSPVATWRGSPYLTKDRVSAARWAGLVVTTRPTSSRSEITRAVLSGVDEVLTGRPDTARAAFARVREALPAPRPAPATPHRILPRAHAHNDYLHTRPLLDAVDAGFTSVEADIVLRDGVLHVAHEEASIRPGRTLASLYLEPLAELVASGRPLTAGKPFQLLVDIKDQPLASYQAIEAALQATLAEHPGLFRQYVGPDSGATAPVEVVVSGARPLAHMQAQTTRWIGYDGRPADLDLVPPLGASLMPLVSADWGLANPLWNGRGPLTTAQQTRLFDHVDRAHAQGAGFRFWGTYLSGPALVRVWTALYDLGFDRINADDLAGLARFTANRDPWFLAS